VSVGTPVVVTGDCLSEIEAVPTVG
jgi:hypothetical protein